MAIKKVCVLGAGIMGAGIAQIAAQAGFDVVLRDIEDRFVEKGMSTITMNFDRAVSKGKIEKTAAEEIMSRIKGMTDLKAAATDADLVIEAIIEIMDLKKKVFKELDELCKPEAILASNTSGLSITEMAAATARPGQVIGMHFFNPVPVMKLVELIKSLTTSDQTFVVAREFVEKNWKNAH